MDAGRPSWDRMMARRKDVRRRFPDPLRLPLTRRPEALIASRLPGSVRLLDVGAGDGSLEGKLRAEGAEVDYTGVDPLGTATVRALDEARGPFGAACLLEVIEHLEPDEGADLLRAVREKLAPGSPVFLSTPNVFKPGQFERDATHKTPYAWEELGALVLVAGFELEGLFRVYNAPWVSRLAHLVVFRWLHRFLQIDCARSVMAVGRR